MLRPTEFYTLLALAAGPQHGYALVQRIERESEGRLSILPGNLYAVIRRLETGGLLRKSHTKPRREEDQRRRYFELTPRGRKALTDEAQHIARLHDRLETLTLHTAKRSGGS